MGTIFCNNIPLSTINPYTLLFKEHSLNIKYNSMQQSTSFPMIIFIFIFFYAISAFICIIITNHNYIEGILITTTLIISTLCLIISLFIKMKKNCVSIKNERLIELTLLITVFILFTFINQIFCAHLKHFNNNNKLLINIVFINIEIVVKCIWTVANVNEFAFVFIGNVVNLGIVIPYNYKKILILITIVNVFIIHSLYAYFFTKIRKEIFIHNKMNIDVKTNDVLGFGYAMMHMNYDNKHKKKITEANILNDCIVNENSYLKNILLNAYEDKENLFLLLNELEDVNEDIKKCLLYCMNYHSKQSLQINEHDNNKHYFFNSGNNLLQTIMDNNSIINNSNDKAHHKIENSLTNLVSKVGNNFNLISNTKYENDLTGKSRTFDGLPVSKFGNNVFNKQTATFDTQPQYTFQLRLSNLLTSNHLVTDSKDDIKLPISHQEINEINVEEINTQKLNNNINESIFLLPLLYTSGLNKFYQQDEFTYLGRKRINNKALKSNFIEHNNNTNLNTTSTPMNSNKHLPVIKNSFDLSLSSPTDYSFYKVYFRFNAICSGLEFVFIDESKEQFENLFKAYSRQVSMYLHDFKNPLTAINEKILDYKDVFESILMESEEQIGTFQFGKNELDDLVFLSITSDDCLNMIKSYEDFSKAIANNDITNESMKLNLSSFYLNEITDYLHDWIQIKNQRTHQELEFVVNNITISDHFKLCTDKLKLKQILINIISNSYKFTKNGEIILTITREKIHNKQYTKFHIRDTGDGMDEITMKKLFNPYFSKNDNNKNKEGCGLGLMLSMRMSKNLGLPIQVESEEKKGTAMWFYIEEREPIEGDKDNTSDNDENGNKVIENDSLINNNNHTITELTNSTVNKAEEENFRLGSKKRYSFNYNINSLNKSDSNFDFIPLNLNDSRTHNSTFIENLSVTKTRKKLSNLIRMNDKSKEHKKINSLQSTDTILCDDIMTIDPKEKSPSHLGNNFISMSPRRPAKMNFNYRVSHRFHSSIQGNNFNNRLWKKKLMKNNFSSSYEDSVFVGLSVIKQEVTMSILGKPPLNDLNLLPQHNNCTSPSYQFNQPNYSQLYRNNYTLNTVNNNQPINNNINVNFSYYKKGTASTNLNKNFSRTKGSTFSNVKSLISKKDTKTTSAFSESVHFKNEHLMKRDKTISVLLVDDDENFQRAHKRLLENLGVDDIVSIYDGIDLMMMFLRNELSSFDLIILDNFMTYLHGTDVAKIIKYMKDNEMGRKCFDFSVLNKIYISTGAQDIAMSSLEQFESVDFLAKPISKNDMEGIIRKVTAGVK